MSGVEVRLLLSRADYELRVDLQLPGSGISVLFGPSGAGKTSVLRCVAGLERARDARVAIGGEVWQDDASGRFVPVHRRALGYVFQEASLFGHLDVRGNLLYGVKRAGSASARARLDAAVELLGIGHLLGRPVGELSGGERQRVAIARALGCEPRVLLMDEPLAALDVQRRQELLAWLERLRDELALPILYVTHSVDELARLADQLVVLEGGGVRACGPVQEVLAAGANALLPDAEVGALLFGRVAERSARWQLARVAFDGGELWLRDSGLAVGRPVRLRALARDVSLTAEEPRATSIQNHFPGVVEAISRAEHPSQRLVRVRCGASALLALITHRAELQLGLAPGCRVWVQLKSAALA